MATEFKLPELGENIESGNVTRVMVSPGDEVKKDQPVIEVETDKAALEVPSEVSGTVEEVRAKEGEPINVGDVVFTIAGGGGGAKKEEAGARAEGGGETAAAAEESGAEAEEEPEGQEAPAGGEQEPVDETGAEEEEPAAEEQEEEASEEPDEPKPSEQAERAQRPPAEVEEKPVRPGGRPVPAAPSVRKLAREIGVDIHDVAGSGPGGRISAEDVKSYARSINTDTVSAAGRPGGGKRAGSAPLPDFSRWGRVERSEMTSVRRRTAEHMAYCWETIPHVTQFDECDVTELEALRQQYKKRVEAQGGKLTLTAMIVKVAAAALQRFPRFNASLDAENGELVLKQYYHVGVAVDTDRGLLVPVLRDVDQKTIVDICAELSDLAERARTRKTKLDEMQGGCFTISNLGGIGGTHFTPIVNAPEVAILGVGRGATRPVFQNGQFSPRTIMPLALSYDHRVIDGADGARFLRWVAEALQNPFLLFLES